MRMSARGRAVVAARSRMTARPERESRQEIETHLVKRAVGKYMHRLWVHQPARIRH
jgi:hypothetical protein